MSREVYLSGRFSLDQPISSETLGESSPINKGENMELTVWFDDKIADFSGAKSQYEQDLVNERAAGKAEGFVEGQGSIVLPDASDPNVQYTQAQMDELANIVRGEKDAEYGPQLEALRGEVAALKSDLESVKAGQDQVVADAKAAMIEKVRSFKASGDQAEDALIAELQA